MVNVACYHLNDVFELQRHEIYNFFAQDDEQEMERG